MARTAGSLSSFWFRPTNHQKNLRHGQTVTTSVSIAHRTRTCSYVCTESVRVARGGARRTRRRAFAPRSQLVDKPRVERLEGGSPRRRRDEVAVLGTRGRRRNAGALCHARTLAMARGVAFVRPRRDRRARPPRLGRSRERARETLDRRHDAVVRRSSCAAAHSAPSHAARRACRGRPSRRFLGHVVCWLLFAIRDALARAPGRSEPPRTIRLRFVSASDPFIAFLRVPRRRRLRKSVRRTSARARLPTPRRPR